jgi:N-acetyl-gamma-glutamyl-phosphate reductase
MKEVGRTLKSLQPNAGAVHFVPWRGDFARGIYVSSTVKTALPGDQVLALYREFYSGHPFTVVTEGTIDMKQVINTNKCLVGIELQGEMVVIHSAIDNLLKGASGQAVQNMNLVFGLEETAGLKLKSIVF